MEESNETITENESNETTTENDGGDTWIILTSMLFMLFVFFGFIFAGLYYSNMLYAARTPDSQSNYKYQINVPGGINPAEGYIQTKPNVNSAVPGGINLAEGYIQNPNVNSAVPTGNPPVVPTRKPARNTAVENPADGRRRDGRVL